MKKEFTREMKHPKVKALMPVSVRVRFNPPDPAELDLTGSALRAYYKWLETPTSDNEEYLAECIYDQCEDYILSYSAIEEWNAITP